MKHWQVFLLMILPTFLSLPSPFSELSHLCATVFSFLWLYALAEFGQAKLKEFQLQPLNLKKFKWHLYSLISFMVLAIFIPDGNSNEGLGWFSWINPILYFPTLLLFLYIFYCFFYILIYIGKLLAKLEYKQEVTFWDSLTHILLFLVMYVWIWFLQPRLNKLFGTQTVNA